MNFLLMRSTQHVVADQVPVQEPPPPAAEPPAPQKSSSPLEGLISEDSFPLYSITENPRDRGGSRGTAQGANAKNDSSFMENHTDVCEDEGWIAIPYRKLPDNWFDAPDIESLRCHDRSFIFPGEQVHVLACLSASKQVTEIITPFKVAAAMTKNGIGNAPQKQNGKIINGTEPQIGEDEGSRSSDQNGKIASKENVDAQKEISVGESILRMEDRKRQTESLLQKFKVSHFFVRISESGEPLWSIKSSAASSESSEASSEKSAANGAKKTAKNTPRLNALVDRGNFDANLSGGVARNDVKCCSLSNGDLVVLLQVNVGVDHLKDPVIEILQFEKSEERKFETKSQEKSVTVNDDPCGDLLKWLLPLDNIIPPSPRPLSPSPPTPISSNSIGSVAQKSSSTGSQLFSFGHFRSYSMSSLPQNPPPAPGPVKVQSSKPSFDLEEWDSSQKLLKNQRAGNEQLLSFRGVSLERQRFSVRCGLEGIYIPGRRWRRKLEIIQPVEIHSFSADCNTDNFLCVQIKNVSPPHAPDIVVYIDAISIVFEEASKGGPPSTLPIACIEAGNDHSLPNLALRRGEEHSFILKPTSLIWKNHKGPVERMSRSSGLRLPSKSFDGKGSSSAADLYAVMVSCRCNYTESRLFFKKSTSWRPRIPRDLMISIASEMSGHSSASNGRDTQLPVQVLTLQASNMTSEDLTLTVLAPASFTAPPTVLSLNCSPKTPITPFVGFSELSGRQGSPIQRTGSGPLSVENQSISDGARRSASFNELAHPTSDVIPSAGLCCSHLWMHSRVPLGCVPSQSSATIKLELLPLTDGIITLDTLQIDVKEKGVTYIPEHSLKINATSSIVTGRN